VIKLVTVGPAEVLYSWWGHSALIVEDTRLGQGRFYNYGLFSFEEANFISNFAMGRLWFQVGAGDARSELALYRSLNRTIVLQTLDLSPAKKLEVARFLEWNILPANRRYLYQHYTDNCATRVRDLIDRAVDGQLSAATAVAGRLTLRGQTRRYTAHHFAMNWLLMFLMSGVIDQPISRWQEMFLPDELAKNVAELVYRDERGVERPLVSDTQLYYQAVGRLSTPEQPPVYWPQWLVIGLLAACPALAAGLLVRFKPRGATALLAVTAVPSLRVTPRGERALRAARALYGAGSALAGLVLGMLGSVLFFMSSFTDHTVTYGNTNLFLANPLTLLALPLGIGAAVGARWALRWLPRLWYLLAALAVVYLPLRLLPFFGLQQNGSALAALLPVLLGFAAAAALMDFERSASSSRSAAAAPR
jgi:hypothetical protein